jgi:GxxExxY protein
MEHREPSQRVDRIARRVIGAAIEVHRHLGPGMLESAYQHALLHELQLQGLEARRHVQVPMDYKGAIVGAYELDFLIEES